MSKLYTIAGTSELKGTTKLRVANDIMRIKVLAKGGHQNITMIELPEPMNKIDAARFLLGLDEFQGPIDQAALVDYLESKGESVEAAAPAAAPEVPELPEDEIEASAEDVYNELASAAEEDLEDAPF